ncbi:hypothetical protein LJ655_12300 [Paraburkholderia sp. MMS20-SJTN17]|uniref:NERD domain-containing protein n=1 Tax=Paraburkholderia translucens TaxID=2886945 RepID=A0ABS8KD12_9BURK|nr:hypothetical protein [Paraburkholderia sp. MMS20-SJTN17]MCC8402663.1 hypothetical protein [Paraburkholderia sp. MMS20-SJTN17]
MNSGKTLNDFLTAFATLLDEVERELGAAAPDPYAGAGQGRPLEAQTRVRFFNRFVSLLGWDLGLGGDMAQEARIRAETTTYMDYVGVTRLTRAPVVLLEVKAWDKPFIGRARGRSGAENAVELLVEGIRFFLGGGAKNDSPVTHEWYEYIEQVTGYVKGLKEQHGHDLARAVLASGQWLVIFTAPVKTFVNGNVSGADIIVLNRADFIANAPRIFSELSRQVLVQDVPFPLRPPQLPDYLSSDRLRAAYRGLLVHYQAKGAKIFARKPQVFVYPAVVLERTDGALLTVVKESLEFELVVSRGQNADGNHDSGRDNIDEHVVSVHAASEELLAECSRELGFVIVVSAIAEFGGFPQALELNAAPQPRIQFVMRATPSGDEWIIVTGEASHILRQGPAVDPCRFHTWSECLRTGEALMQSAINFPRVQEPRSFFVDGQKHHCAHRTLDERRTSTCYVRSIDQRVCCQACVFSTQCWSGGRERNLPCGG